MTAAVKAVLDQAKRLSPEELAELRAELDALEDPAWAAAWKTELNRVLESSARLTLLPKGQRLLGAQLAAQPLPQRTAHG